MVRLDIFSDPICPWCFIGKRNLDDALIEARTDVFDIRWHPFQLNPQIPIEGMNRRVYLEGKFGGKKGAVKAYTPIVEHAANAGLSINVDTIKRTPNTLNSHLLIHWAEAQGVQTQLVETLFTSYFLQELDLSNNGVLRDIAHSVGMESNSIKQKLITKIDLDEIKGRDAASRKMGLTGVPAFIVAGKHVVQGAQGAELWSRVINDIEKQISQQEIS